MSKIFGYIIMALGVVAAGIPLFVKSLAKTLPPIWGGVVGLMLIVAGFFFVKSSGSSSSHKQISEEVPIYHKDKIVGYRKANK